MSSLSSRSQFALAAAATTRASQKDILLWMLMSAALLVRSVVTVTTSSRPVFEGKLLKEGTHINAIGAYRPDMQEVDEEALRRSRIFVDSLEACLEEAGDLVIPLKTGRLQKTDILAELGEVFAGKKPGRGSAREITYFKSVGNAVQDVSVGQAILHRAREKNLGQEVEL